jgi:hypothetical protein
MEPISKLSKTATPAKAGVQKVAKMLDSGFRRNDNNVPLKLAQQIKIKFSRNWWRSYND